MLNKNVKKKEKEKEKELLKRWGENEEIFLNQVTTVTY